MFTAALGDRYVASDPHTDDFELVYESKVVIAGPTAVVGGGCGQEQRQKNKDQESEAVGSPQASGSSVFCLCSLLFLLPCERFVHEARDKLAVDFLA